LPPSRASRSRRAAASSDAPKRQTIASRLARLGLRSDWDFLLHLPLRYEDETRITPIAALQPGAEAQVEGTVCRSEIVRRGGRQLAVRLQDASGELLLRFLHFYPSQVKLLATGRRVRVFGAARGGLAGMEMVHPRVKAADADVPLAVRLTPVYPGTEGVPQRWLRKRIERALRDVELTDTLPAALIERCRLLPLAAALGTLHQPPIDADPAALSERSGPQWERIKFDEALAQQISLRLARAERQSQRAPALAAGTLAARLLAALPFELTAAQRRACDEIHADLERHTPMHRLVQGDVGSGKTVVAALAAACTIDSGYQAALMAPTEILAEQHFRRIEHWLAPLGVRVAWLAGKLAAADKRAAQVAVADGSAQLVIGTHALIQKAVDFARLGLAIVDEQHRFGVAQRLRLRQGARDGRTRPHLLMLSATPIPRTLAMSYLADLDVSVIDELPPGRRPVITKLVGSGRRNEVLARVRGEIAQGRQAYWVCPLVDESGDPAPDAGDAGLTSPSGRGTARRPDRCAGRHHRGRGRRRRAQRLADGDRACAALRAGATASAARQGRAGRGAELLRAAVRRPAVGGGTRATARDLPDPRRLRGRTQGPAVARTGRVPRRPPGRRRAVAFRRSGA
jgi:ATP-dependent DNA helicase RecG